MGSDESWGVDAQGSNLQKGTHGGTAESQRKKKMGRRGSRGKTALAVNDQRFLLTEGVRADEGGKAVLMGDIPWAAPATKEGGIRE